jgi:hypothetical protein
MSPITGIQCALLSPSFFPSFLSLLLILLPLYLDLRDFPISSTCLPRVCIASLFFLQSIVRPVIFYCLLSLRIFALSDPTSFSSSFYHTIFITIIIITIIIIIITISFSTLFYYISTGRLTMCPMPCAPNLRAATVASNKKKTNDARTLNPPRPCL